MLNFIYLQTENYPLKKTFQVCLFAVITALSGCTKVQPTEELNKGDIVPSISVSKQMFKIGKSIPVTFTLTNTTRNAIKLLSWGTPLEANITRDQFRVLYNGKELAYQGIMVKRAQPKERDYFQLGSNQSLNSTIDISQSYSFKQAGIYTLQYKESFLDIKTVEGLNHLDASNSISITVIH